MSRDINWERWNKTMDGVFGYGARPYYDRRGSLPTKAQMNYIEDLVKELEDAGVRASFLIEDGYYKKHSGMAVSVIRALIRLRSQAGMSKGARSIYVNLCKEKATGKKIKYKTSKRFAAPTGYEFLGEISRSYVYPEGEG